jgi:hypothetical protein
MVTVKAQAYDFVYLWAIAQPWLTSRSRASWLISFALFLISFASMFARSSLDPDKWYWITWVTPASFWIVVIVVLWCPKQKNALLRTNLYRRDTSQVEKMR